MESKSYVFKNKKETETGGSKFITIKKDPSKKPVMILSSIVNEFSLSAQQQQSPPKSQIKKEENKEKEEENKIEKKEEKKEEKEEEKKEEIKIIKKPILSFSNQIQDSISIAPITQNKIIIDSEDKKKEEIKIIKKPLLSLSSQPQDSISIEPIIPNQIKIDLEDKKKEKKKSPEVKSLSPIIQNQKKKIEISECPQISFNAKATNIINIKKKKKPITNDDILKEIEKINQEEEKIRLRKASKRKEKDKRKKKNKNERPQSVNYDRRNQNSINITTNQFNVGSKKQELSFIPQAEFALGNINNIRLKKILEKQKDFSINKAADFICEGDPILIQNRKDKKKGKKEEVKVNYPPFDIDQFLQEYYNIK